MTADDSRASRLLDEDEQQAANVANPLYMPWQALSALAFETGQAVRQTFSESGVSTTGHVQQGTHHHISSNETGSRNYPDHTDQPQPASNSSAGPESIDVKPGPGNIDQGAVQADITRVQRKMLSTDAAKEVILRFNFLSGRESKVRQSITSSCKAFRVLVKCCVLLQAALLCIVVSILMGAGVLIAEFVRKMQQGNKPYPFRHLAVYDWNVAVGSTCLLLVTISLTALTWRVLDAVRLHKRW